MTWVQSVLSTVNENKEVRSKSVTYVVNSGDSMTMRLAFISQVSDWPVTLLQHFLQGFVLVGTQLPLVLLLARRIDGEVVHPRRSLISMMLM